VLHRLLTDHNADHAEYAFQLRVAVHAGEVHYDEWGQYGEALDITCLLLDAPEFRRALTNNSAPLMLVVSDDIYRTIVRHRYDEIDDRTYRPIVQIEVDGVAYAGWVQGPTSDSPTMRWPRHPRIAG
jgi:hypothetical protein